MCGHTARVDADQIGSELRKLCQHEAVDAFADRSQQDHGRDADRYPKGGQAAA